MPILKGFAMPNAVKITGRTSSITNSLVNGIIPVIPPTQEEVTEAFRILNLNPDDLRCAYCGDSSTEWDHLRPLIIEKKPTGYISEITNLVPACGKCNQSKGNKNWREWMLGKAKKSPAMRGIQDLEERIERLEAYEKWHDTQPINLEDMVGSELWAAYQTSYEIIIEAMKQAQILSNQIKDTIKQNYRHRTEK